MAQTTPIGVALIGGGKSAQRISQNILLTIYDTGIWAREEHAPAIEAAKTLTLKAVYSRSAVSAKSLADSISYPVDLYSEDGDRGLDELLKRTDIGAVIIALSIESQPRFIKAALLSGKHVLSEKPIAENIQDAEDLIKWYRTDIKGPTWAVAENWRYLNSYNHAANILQGLGKIVGFQGRQHNNIGENWKFNLTPWRRTPTHQGGYLLDGGVHFTAGLRLLLGSQPGNEIDTLSAFTNQIQPHLPPVDTGNMILKTRSGVSGVLQISLGTSLRANEWTIACEDGWVKIEGENVTVCRDSQGDAQTVTIKNERTGVPPEVEAWGASLVAGKVVSEQEPEAALADLELIELMLRSGNQGGTPLTCKHQDI
ncbi:hypothetical protein N7490_010206 [Penicillium lividum]|nr:hypothetical protein N7490_010206 [Penicillium lividum]